MRKIVAWSFITSDRVLQAVGGPRQGFEYGGLSTGIAMKRLVKLLKDKRNPAATFPLEEKILRILPHSSWTWRHLAWCQWSYKVHYEQRSGKFSFSEKRRWYQKLRNSKGSDIKVHGSDNLEQALLKHDLADKLWLLMHPLTPGTGNKLFADGTIPAAFTLARLQKQAEWSLLITSEQERLRRVALEVKRNKSDSYRMRKISVSSG